MAKVNVLLLPEPGSGHFMSLVEAGKRLLVLGGGTGGDRRRELTVTVLVVWPATAASASEIDAHVRHVEASGLAGIRFHRLPAAEPPMECAGNVQEFKSRYMELQKPHVMAAARELRATALVVDMFATTVLDVAREVAVPAYVYFTSTAAMLALTLRLPALDADLPEDLEAFQGAVDVPGLPAPVPGTAIPASFNGRKTSPGYKWFSYHGRRFMEASGIIINTVSELEQGIVKSIAQGQCVPGRPVPPLYPIGPAIDLDYDVPGGDDNGCICWLDAQPRASVVFLCFGSMGWCDAAKAFEVAAGLERSGHRFLWALRGPPTPGSSRHPTDADLNELLPAGFLDRTGDRGLVWPKWAPQKRILSHPAVGGFVSHCGWNSTLESLWHGVPLVPWPLYAEQHLNAFELVVAMGVAVRMEVDRKRDNFVEAAELERAVRSLMGDGEEGRKVRVKVQEAKDACRNALKQGGSSYASVQSLIEAIPSAAAA